MKTCVLLLLLLIPSCEFTVRVGSERDNSKCQVLQDGPSKQQLQKWFERTDSAPPASWYKNGDPWRNLTSEEVEALLEPDDQMIGVGG